MKKRLQLPATGAQKRVLVEVGRDTARALARFTSNGEDARLLELGIGVGQLGQYVRNGHRAGMQVTLTKIAAHCVGWLETNPGPIKDVFAAVVAERKRQIALRTDNPKRYTFDLSKPLPDPKRKFRVLLEEVGEVAKECDQLEQKPRSRKVWPFLRDELVQVAAVAVAWLESYEVAA